MPVLSRNLNPNVFKAILAMDSYNRGYGSVVADLSQRVGNIIGTATVLNTGLPAGSEPAGFYAVAYNWNGQNVISYRGTNTDANGLPNFNDVQSGWTLGAGYPFGEQGRLAIEFYKSVANITSIHTTFDNIGRVEEHAAAVPEVPAYPADAVIRFQHTDVPLAIFLATSDSKALQALVLKMELEKYQKKPCNVVLLVERAKQNPLREATYAMSQARLDDVLTYRGAEAETMLRLSNYSQSGTMIQ